MFFHFFHEKNRFCVSTSSEFWSQTVNMKVLERVWSMFQVECAPDNHEKVRKKIRKYIFDEFWPSQVVSTTCVHSSSPELPTEVYEKLRTLFFAFSFWLTKDFYWEGHFSTQTELGSGKHFGQTLDFPKCVQL